MTRRTEPKLRPAPDKAWEAEYARLLRDPYLKRKYDRAARLKENIGYICDYLPEVTGEGKGVVVDVGPGPGEFLEWCRQFGWFILGIDAMSGDGGMGDGYLQLSRLLHARQGLDVRYCGWRQFTRYLAADANDTDVALFNFRGSWAQCYDEYVDGPPHHLHHDVKKQRWRFGYGLRSAWIDAFEIMERRLVEGGIVLIAANRLGEQSGQDQYAKEICDVAHVCGLRLVKSIDNWVHKWVKD